MYLSESVCLHLTVSYGLLHHKRPLEHHHFPESDEAENCLGSILSTCVTQVHYSNHFDSII